MASRNVRHLVKRTSVSGKIPTGTTDDTQVNLILQGELALNTADHKLFSYDGVNIFEIGDRSYLNFSGGTVSGGTNFSSSLSASTYFSGSTPLETIINNIAISYGSNTFIQNGLNTYTGGTSSLPTINVSAATLDNLFVSGNSRFNSASAYTFSANTLKLEVLNSTPTHTEGLIFYNGDGLSAYLDEPDITLNIGQEQYVKGKNAQGATISNGQAVYIGGASGQLPEFYLANASAHTTAHLIGLATHDIEFPGNGYVTTQGLVRGIPTSGFSEGDIIYLSLTSGTLTNIAPPAPYHITEVGVCVVSHPSNGSILVYPTQAVDLNDISKVYVDENNLVDGQTLVYSGAGGYFFNRKLNLSDLGNSAHTHSISEINNLSNSLNTKSNLSGATFTGDVFGTALSATTLSGGTIYSGTSLLETIIYNIASSTELNDITRVQPGSNISTGGTANAPTVNLVASPSVNGLNFSGTATGAALSATTLSGGTIYSGTSLLETIIYNIASSTELNDITRVQPGTNTYTGGTSNAPTVNISGGSFNNISLSGQLIHLTSQQLLYSGTTDVGDFLGPLYFKISNQNLEFGSGPENSFPTYTSGFRNINFGIGNSLVGNYSFFAGATNTGDTGTFACFAVGQQNQILETTQNSIILGVSNIASGASNSLILGNTNFNGSQDSIIAGDNNYNYQDGSIVVGYNSTNNGGYSSVFGAGNINYGTRSGIFGLNNIINDGPTQLFVFGSNNTNYGNSEDSSILAGSSNSFSGINQHSSIVSGEYNKLSAVTNSSILAGSGNSINRLVANSSVLAGRGHTILEGVQNSSIMAGININAGADNTAYGTNITALSTLSGQSILGDSSLIISLSGISTWSVNRNNTEKVLSVGFTNNQSIASDIYSGTPLTVMSTFGTHDYNKSSLLGAHLQGIILDTQGAVVPAMIELRSVGTTKAAFGFETNQNLIITSNSLSLTPSRTLYLQGWSTVSYHPGAEFGMGGGWIGATVDTAWVKHTHIDNANGVLRFDVAAAGSRSTAVYMDSTRNIGIGGITSPTARLHLTAGTTSANSAPLKFNTGSYMSSPEVGALEWDNGVQQNLAFTDGTGTRRWLAFTDEIVGGSGSTLVQPGSNISTGGTSTIPIINLVSSPSINGLNFSGTATGAALSATTISATTYYSGTSLLSSVLHPSSGYLLQKSGVISGTTFSGNPKKATITFSTAFPNNNYAVVVTGESNRTWTIESKTAAGFTVNSNSNTTISSNTFWIAQESGEGYR